MLGSLAFADHEEDYEALACSILEELFWKLPPLTKPLFCAYMSSLVYMAPLAGSFKCTPCIRCIMLPSSFIFLLLLLLDLKTDKH